MEKYCVPQKTGSLWRENNLQSERRKAERQFQVFHFTRGGGEKSMGWTLAYCQLAGGKMREKHTAAARLFFFLTPHSQPRILHHKHNNNVQLSCAPTHTHTHSWLVEGHISEMLDPTNSSFSVLLENPLPFPRPFWLCLNVHLSHSLARCIFKGTADFVHTVHEKLSNSIIMQKPFWCAVFLYTICCHVFL